MTPPNPRRPDATAVVHPADASQVRDPRRCSATAALRGTPYPFAKPIPHPTGRCDDRPLSLGTTHDRSLVHNQPAHPAPARACPLTQWAPAALRPEDPPAPLRLW